MQTAAIIPSQLAIERVALALPLNFSEFPIPSTLRVWCEYPVEV